MTCSSGPQSVFVSLLTRPGLPAFTPGATKLWQMCRQKESNRRLELAPAELQPRDSDSEAMLPLAQSCCGLPIYLLHPKEWLDLCKRELCCLPSCNWSPALCGRFETSVDAQSKTGAQSIRVTEIYWNHKPHRRYRFRHPTRLLRTGSGAETGGFSQLKPPASRIRAARLWGYLHCQTPISQAALVPLPPLFGVRAPD